MTIRRNPVVSVVIPVYNAKKYLPSCLHSVAEQTIGTDKLEIVIVDDGSTDGSTDYLREFAESRPNVKLICLPQNTGCPGHVRNVGIEVATGDWLYCVDADDWLGPEALERLVKHAEEWGSDVIQGRMKEINWDTSKGATRYFSGTEASIPNGDLVSDGVLTSSLGPIRLIKMKLIQKRNIRFPEDSWFEDTIFMLRVLFSSSVISMANDYDYYFIRRDANRKGGLTETATVSGMKRPDKIVKGISAVFDLIDENSKLIQQSYLKIIKKIFTTQLYNQAFAQIEAYADYNYTKYPDKGLHFKKQVWQRVSRYYTNELKTILPIEDILRYDYIQNGIFDDAEMSILHFCNPLPVNTVAAIDSEDFNKFNSNKIKKEAVLTELNILAPDTRERLYKSSLSSVIFVIEEVRIDRNLKLVIKGRYKYPLMITKEPEIYPVLENKHKLTEPESVRIQKDYWGEPYQGSGYWYASYVCSECLQRSDEVLCVKFCFECNEGDIIEIEGFRASCFSERLLSVDVPYLRIEGSDRRQILIDLGNEYRSESLNDQLASIKQNLDNTKQKLDDTKRKLDNTKQKLDDSKRKLDNTKQKLDDSKRKLEKIQNRNEENIAKLAKVREQLNRMKNSKSWRLTKPLRGAANLFHRMFK